MNNDNKLVQGHRLAQGYLTNKLPSVRRKKIKRAASKDRRLILKELDDKI